MLFRLDPLITITYYNGMKYKFSKSVVESTKKELRKIAEAKKSKLNPYLYMMLKDVNELENYYKAVIAGNAEMCDKLYMQMDTAVYEMIPNRIFNAVIRQIWR